jgi:hypothetical protein
MRLGMWEEFLKLALDKDRPNDTSNTELLCIFTFQFGTFWIEKFHINGLVEVALSFCLLISLGLSFWGYEAFSLCSDITHHFGHADMVPTMLTNGWTELEFRYVVCQASPSVCLAVFMAKEFSKIFLG